MRNKFDVIIIGAGPAGLKCAEQFKNTALSVLLIEKNKIIGPKVCAGGLVTNLIPSFEIPESKIKKFSKQTIYFLNQKYEINLAHPLKIINRYDLGQYLLSKIKNLPNITILKETMVEKIEADKIITNRGIFYYQNLVGADGAVSIVRRYLGIESKILIGMRYKSFKITNKLVVYFNFNLLKAKGYLWVFPHLDYTDIGIGFDPKLLIIKEAKEILKNFLKENNYINKNKNQNFETAPMNYLYKGCIFGNIFLVGDAAGLTSGATGEGIAPALVSGREIGRKILEPSYKMEELNKILKIKKRQEKFRKIFDQLPLFKKEFYRIFLNLLSQKWFQLYYFGN